MCSNCYTGDIRDEELLNIMFGVNHFAEIYHLAAILSTAAEANFELAHEVNVGGTVSLLGLASGQARVMGSHIRFLFPSSIAVYGMRDRKRKRNAGAITEDQFNQPSTMYGWNKLYCEQLGKYYARQSREQEQGYVDFRSLRFPGIISAHTVPIGGTSDYAPQMLHAAAKGEPYSCFVAEDTRIPFMTMPDAIAALLQLAAAGRAQLSQEVYNVTGFSPTAAEFAERTLKALPGGKISFEPVEYRQAIVDSWPADIDDSKARRDWDFKPQHDFDKAFADYLLPAVKV